MNTKAIEQADPLTMQIIQGRFDSIMKEMAYKIIRSAYSSIVRESEDMGAAIFTMEGEELCESETTPMMMGTMNGYMKGLRKVLKERQIRVHEGDALIHNHPYYGASHAQDIGVISPIFYKGRQVAWSTTAAHHCDTGSAIPGLAVVIPDMYGESNYFLGQKLFDKGKRCDDLWNVISDNVRVPKEVLGDLAAQVGACRVGEKRFCDLLDDYGDEVVMNIGRVLLDYSERFMRAQIEKVPNGVYEAEQYCDSDGKDLDKLLPVKVKVTIKGSDIEVDLTGSADQVDTARNVPFEGSTCTAIWFTFRTILTDQAVFTGFIPQNAGVFRPIKVYAPLGSMFNPKYPAACNERFNQLEVLSDTIIKALSPVIPLCAGTSACCPSLISSGIHPRTQKYWVIDEVIEGAYGGEATKDGMSAVDILVANTQNNPIEYLEMEYPMRVMRYEYNVDSTGAGKYRGGFGIIKVNKWTAPVKMTVTGDRSKQRPWGFNGGKEGTPFGLTKILRDGQRMPLHSVPEGVSFDVGDSVEVQTASAGGWGDPFDRTPDLVLKDYLNGLISKETAEKDYGVAITEDNKIDVGRTNMLRSRQPE